MVTISTRSEGPNERSSDSLDDYGIPTHSWVLPELRHSRSGRQHEVVR